MQFNITLRLFAITALSLLGTALHSYAQSPTDISNLSGNFEVNAQYYIPDSAIGTEDVPEKLLSNGYMNLNYTYGKFSAGIRYESYLNPLLGFDPNFKGVGIPYKYATFMTDNLTITAGNFYEQFGNGLILRAYEDKALGLDNALNGIYVKFVPTAGLTLKGFIARQRKYFDYPDPLVRGFDGDLQINDAFKKYSKSKLRVAIGGSFVSKYQKDNSNRYILPENVASFAGRTNIYYGKFAINAEVAYKYNDPSYDNKYIYKSGDIIYLNFSYSEKGTGIRLNMKRVDNMSYRSDRDASLNLQLINYIPAVNKQLTYRLSTLYPFSTQPLGEQGIGAEVYKTFAPGTKWGGDYGTSFSLSGSAINNIQKSPAENDTLGYTSDFLTIGKPVYYNDFVLEMTKKIDSKNKVIFTYIYQLYNNQVLAGYPGMITTNIGVIEYTYKITKLKSLRFELQELYTEQDKGSWAMVLVEYSVAPHWSATVFDEWNYGNDDPNHRFHYYSASMAYTKGATRISMGYARQRKGLLCVGGVCRVVPAATGFNISITSSF